MNQRIILATLLAIATVVALNVFGPSSQKAPSVPTDATPGQAYRVPSQQVLSTPLNREVDFVDEKRKSDEQIIRFSTKRYNLGFSTFGGVLSYLDFKRHTGDQELPLRTVFPANYFEQERGCFLVALGDRTPYYYSVKDSGQTDEGVHITLEGASDEWKIIKEYFVSNDSYIVELKLSCIPLKKEVSTNARIFYPAPYLSQIAKDTISGATSGVGAGSVSTVAASSMDENAWIMPALFGAQDQFFAHMMVKDSNNFTQRSFFKKLAAHQVFSVLEGPGMTEKSEFSFSFYMGPKLYDELHVVDERLEGLLSFGWLSWICKLLLQLLQWLYSLLGNYGFAIIALTILVKIPFLPITMRARQKMMQFQSHQPALNRIRQKYKNDVQRQHAEMLHYYKEHNLSPASQMMGCLPFLFQIPILFSLYRVLSNYIELYHAPFIGWIVDLSAPDPYYVLPLVMGASMLFQQRIASTGGDERQRVMMMFVSVVFTAMFINFPAGLVLYWAMNNILAVAEELLRRKVMP